MPVISRSSTADSEESRDGFTLSDHVPAGATNRETSIRVDSDATIERLAVRIYTGAELDLQLEPVRRTTDGNTPDQPLLEYSGKRYIDGDDDRYQWIISEPVEEGDEIVLKATNKDGSNAYDYRANFDVDYHGGSSRGPLNFIKGVL